MTFVSAPGPLDVEHLDGIPWWSAPSHRWWRRHHVQSRVRGSTVLPGVELTERCSCGAMRLDGRRWIR